MSYPGGKAGDGVYQAIINQIPPHRVYIEPFAGSAAIARFKRAAEETVLIDKDPLITIDLARLKLPKLEIHTEDCVDYLRAWRWNCDEFVYCDPPYLLETRSTRSKIYRHEFCTRKDHLQLLSLVRAIPAAVMISGYPNALYGDVLRSWRTIDFSGVSRGGRRTERLWMNYPEPVVLHDYRYLGKSFRERERIKRRQHRWKRRLVMMDPLERAALLSAIQNLNLVASPHRPIAPGLAMLASSMSDKTP
jgi:site-specific DNA-adenine methylase